MGPMLSMQDVWQMIAERDFALLQASREIAKLQSEVAALKSAAEDKKPTPDKKG